jgi:2-methylcitrate dehydratase PrpD
MENLSRIYSKFATEIQFEDLPPEVVLQAKKCILDFLGVALVGSTTELASIVFDYFSEIAGKSETTVIGKKRRVPAINAALMNGVFAHVLELDDGHRWSGIHPGSPTIPAALAAAELSGTLGRELIVGTVVGYEIILRIGKAINPSHLLRGFHSTGTVGPFGAAAAAGRILGLDPAKMIQALGLAGLHAAGLLQVMHEGGMAKAFHPGKAASGGLFSAQMAMKGAVAPEQIFEGEKGFLRAMSDKTEFKWLTEGLGTRFETSNIYFKIHSSCRHTHPAIDALLKILKEEPLDPNRIERIRVETYPVALQFCGHELGEGTLTPSDAKLSLRFSLSLAVLNGSCGIDIFNQRELARPEVQRLAQRIELTANEKWGALYPEKRGANVFIWVDGRVLQSEVELARGEPENPISMDELYRKFETNATHVIPLDQAQRLQEAVMDLERLSVSEVTEFLK